MMEHPGRNINCVVFDFAFTLCSELYGGEYSQAVSRYVFEDDHSLWADPWARGEISYRDVAAYLSSRISIPADEIASTMRRVCSNLSFNPAVWELALEQREKGRKLALVTVNMDVFSEVVVPAHGLDSVFDVIVNSSDHGTLDKTVLWGKAFDALGSGYGYESSLLIDDCLPRVQDFAGLGGLAYRYQSDEALREWIAQTEL